MSQIRLNFLGRFEVKIGENSITGFHSDKARALFVYLALEQRICTRRALAGLLWPDISDQNALTNLRNTLHRLRQTLNHASSGLADQLFTVTRQSVEYNTNFATIDVVQFELLTGRYATEPATQAEANSRLARLIEAMALYQGALLAGLDLHEATLFEEWLYLRREILQQRALQTLSLLARELETEGKYPAAYEYALRIIALDPFREDGYRILLRLLAQMGMANQALNTFEEMRRLFQEELDVEPSKETKELMQQIAASTYPPPAPSADIEASTALTVSSPVATLRPDRLSLAQNWQNPPQIGPFFGRDMELEQLASWQREGCNVVIILGIGGVGKTSLAAHCAQIFAGRFDVVIWRSMLNAPTRRTMLPSVLEILSDGRLPDLPTDLDEQLQMLIALMRTCRVLLILDNLESILQAEPAGSYRDGYEEYGQLIASIAIQEHQGHLLITSRERPTGYLRLESDHRQVRSLRLDGLDEAAGQELLTYRGLRGQTDENVQLIRRYSGNPLALKLVTETVEELFGGDISQFLIEETLVFDDIRAVLDQQIARLSALEREILIWLAVEREPVAAPDLRQNFLYLPTQRAFIEALRSLQRRSLIERQVDGFALQNVVGEYLSDQIVEQAFHELETGKFDLLHQHALLKASATEYVRQSQTLLLLAPIAERLVNRFGREVLVVHVAWLLDRLRGLGLRRPSYAGGNILNLLLNLQLDITGVDFSHLAIRQAYLRSANLPSVNFEDAEFAQVALGDTFGDIRSLAYSPDGRLIAAGTAAGEIALWDTEGLQLIALLRDDAAPIWSVAFSPNSALLAGGGSDHLVRLWDVRIAQPLARLAGHTKTVRCVTFSPDGTTLASSGDDRTVHLWDVAQRQLRQTLENGHGHSIRAVAFSPNGALLASGSDDQKILLWDLQSGAMQRVLRGHGDWVMSVAFSPDGALLASGSYDQTVMLWDLGSGQLQRSLHGHTGWVEAVAFSPDGTTVASGADDQTVRLWNVNSGQLQQTLLGHSGKVNAVSYSPDGAMLASGDDDRNLFLWDVQRRQPHHRLLGHLLTVESVAFSSDGQMLASGNGDQTVRFWHKTDHEGTAAIHYAPKPDPVHVGHVTVIDFSPDGKLLAGGTADRTVHLIDVERGQIRNTLRGHDGWIKAVAFGAAGKVLASGGTDHAVRLWNTQNGQLQHIMAGHDGWVNAVAFGPDDTLLASGGADEIICLWDVASGALRRTFAGHVGWVTDLVFSRDGEILFSAGADGTVRLWKVETGHLLQTLEAHRGWVWKVAISHDGQIMATGSHDRTVRLWNIEAITNSNGADRLAPDSIGIRHTIGDHAPWVTDIAVNSRARLLATSSGDQTVRLWDIGTGTWLQTLKVPGPYEGMKIAGLMGISQAQRTTLLMLGAVE